jgi:branched-chain amino acid transport system substrate-binding protein
MNLKVFTLTLISLVSIWIAFLSGCDEARQVVSPEVSAPSDMPTVKIGVIQPSGFAVSFTKGAELAKAQINNDGGVLGMPIEFLIRDNQGTRDSPDAAESIRFARELIEQDDIVALLGPLFSTNSEQVGPIVTQLRRPMIPASSGQNVTTVGGEFVFLIVAPSSVQAATMAEFVTKENELNVKTAAILLQTDDTYSMNVVDAFQENFQASGGEIVGNEIYQRGDRAFDAQLMNIKTEAPDALFISGFNPEVPLIMKQAREMGIDSIFIGGDGWDEPEKLLGTLDNNTPLEGSYFVRDFSTESPDAAPFVQAYTTMFMMPPDGPAAWGYDAMSVLAIAMESAGTLEPDAVRDALASITDYQGASAIAGYDEDRHPIKSVAIHTIRNGQIVLYKTVSRTVVPREPIFDR